MKLRVLFIICVKRNMLSCLAAFSYFTWYFKFAEVWSNKEEKSHLQYFVLCLTLVCIILVYPILVFDWKAVYFIKCSSSSIFLDFICPIVLWCCGTSWWKCFRYLSYNYKVFRLDNFILPKLTSKNFVGCLFVICWNWLLLI